MIKMKLRNLIVTTSLLFIAIAKINAQCNYTIANLPDTILACKNSIVPLNPTINIVGNSPYFVDTIWSPATNLSNPDIINPSVNVATTSSSYLLTVQGVTPLNLIGNGDFGSGNLGFTSSYGYGTGGTWGLLSNSGEYAIDTNPFNTHVNFASFGDHTTGTGNMMVVNGASTANVNIWCQTIAVTPNTLYDFSAWGATCVASAPAILQFAINGNLIGTPLALPLTTGVWTQFHATWNSGTNTSITICITDQATAASGNDFAIDDIAFKQICEVKDSVYVDVINLTPAIQIVKNLGCKEDSIQFNALNGIGNTPSSYFWTLGTGIFSVLQNPSHIYQTQGVYNIKLVTELNGCKDSVITTLNTLHPLIAAFSADDTFCVGNASIVNTSVTSLATTQFFDWGDGTIVPILPNQNITHPFTKPGIYHFKLIITDILGCIDSVSKDIYIIEGPYVSMTASDSEICTGEAITFFDSINQFTQSTVWDFSNGTTYTNLHNPLHAFESNGTFVITLIGKNAKCPDVIVKDTIKVTEYPYINLGRDTSICFGVTAAIQLNEGENQPYQFVWNDGTTNSTLLVGDAGKYWVTTIKDGCSTSDTIEVKRDCYLNIPNSFSPNADGLNDNFLPRDILSSGLASFNMNIYNRWGERIFTTSNINGSGWDGKFGGKNQPIGTYVYQIDVVYNNKERKSYTGNVTLLR